MPLLGTHWLGPLPFPERSVQEKLVGQSALVRHRTPQNDSSEMRLRTQRSPGLPHSTSPVQGVQSGRPPRQEPTTGGVVLVAGRQRLPVPSVMVEQMKPPAQVSFVPQAGAQKVSPLDSAWQVPPAPHWRSLVQAPHAVRLTGT